MLKREMLRWRSRVFVVDQRRRSRKRDYWQLNYWQSSYWQSVQWPRSITSTTSPGIFDFSPGRGFI
jgi:hypothetical protein